MYSSFLGIEIGKRGLFAHQRAQNTVSHNVNNAKTPGYSRQRADMEAIYSRYGSGVQWQVGTGVKVSDVNRIRDDFSDMQYRNENSSLGYWYIQRDVLKQVEAIYNEPSDIGISAVFNDFWKSIETLSKDASSEEARETVKESAVTLATTINHASQQLTDIQNDINYRMSVKVDEVNSIAKQISQIDAEIQELEITGYTAPDLRDKRDLLIDELSGYVDLTTYEDENGLFTVNVGGAILVKGNDHATMEFQESTDSNKQPKIVWKDYGDAPVNLTRGEIKSLEDLRDKKVGKYLEDLETFATTFADKFNEIHKEGYNLDGKKGEDFFIVNKDTDSKEILKVSNEIINNPSKIAAAGTNIKNEKGDPIAGVPGDNKNALALSDLRNKVLDFNNSRTATVDDFYGAMVSKIGVDSREAKRMTESQHFMVSQIDERRKSISGVSLDEEMTNMILNQHAYTAAIRAITAIDEMIDTVVNRMGIVGR